MDRSLKDTSPKAAPAGFVLVGLVRVPRPGLAIAIVTDVVLSVLTMFPKASTMSTSSLVDWFPVIGPFLTAVVGLLTHLSAAAGPAPIQNVFLMTVASFAAVPATVHQPHPFNFPSENVP